MKTRRVLLGAALCATILAVMPFGTFAQHPAGHPTAVQADALNWTRPAAYPEGAQLAVISGDPTREGFYVVRLRVPAGLRIAPHTHPNDENLTVLSGTFHIGTGERFEEGSATRLTVGGYSYVPRGMAHYAWASEDAVIQLHGVGPQGITYVNPTDDPRRR